jgi:hypothetical protein
MKKPRNVLCALSGLLVFSLQLFAGGGPASLSEGPEDYRLEISASLWRMNAGGTIHADSTGVNLVSDLGVSQRQRIYDGRLVLKFHRKQRFVFEGTPISIHGLNTVNRTVSYFGDQFSVSDTLKSSAQINYVYGGFHHDWVSGSMGRFGTSIGAAYLGLSGRFEDEKSGIDKSNSTPFGLPLAGLDFRLYLIPHKRWIAMEGAVRGLPAGKYGHWVEGTAGIGGWLGPIGLQVGYRELLVDFHQTGVDPNGVNLRFQGPAASALWNW